MLTTSTNATSTNATSTDAATTTAPRHRPDPVSVQRAVDKRSYLLLATTSEAGRPHAAGVLYARAGDALWISTTEGSRKARNIASSGRAAATIPVRRMPFGAPPSGIQFQASARVVPLGDPELMNLAADGRLKPVTSHGELELPGGAFLRIALPRRVLTYGLGMSLLTLARDPLGAGGSTEVAWT